MRRSLTVLLIVLTILITAADGRTALAAASSAAPVAASTSTRAIPIGAEPIAPETAARVTRLARWGKGEIRTRVYSADGSTMAVGTWVGVAVYDAATLVERRFFETGEPISGLALSPDGSIVIAAGTETELGTRVWRVSDGVLLGQLDATEPIALSADGQYLAAERAGAGIRVWRLDDLTLLRTHTIPAYSIPSSLTFSPDGQLLATAVRQSGSDLLVWRQSDGSLLRAFEHRTSLINQIAFGSDGQSLTTLSSDRKVRVWSLADGSLTREVAPEVSSVLSPDGSALISVKAEQVTLTRLADGATLANAPANDSNILNGALAFTPDGQIVAHQRSDRDGTVVLWRLTDGAVVGALHGYDPEIAAAWLSPDGGTLLTGVGDDVRVQRLADGSIVNVIRDAPVLAFSPDGQTMATRPVEERPSAGRIDHVVLRRVADGAVLSTLESGPPVAFSPDGSLLATPNGVWRVADGARVLALTPPDGVADLSSPALTGGCPSSSVFSHDGTTLACAWGDGALSLYRVADSALLTTWDGHRGPPIRGRARGATTLAFSPDDQLLMSGSADGTGRLWHLPDGAALGSFAPGEEGVRPVAFTPDSGVVVAATQYGHLLLWPVADPAARPIRLEGHVRTITSISASADGRLLVTTSNDGTVVFWGVQ